MFRIAKSKVEEQRVLSKYRKFLMDNWEFCCGRKPFFKKRKIWQICEAYQFHKFLPDSWNTLISSKVYDYKLLQSYNSIVVKNLYSHYLFFSRFEEQISLNQNGKVCGTRSVLFKCNHTWWQGCYSCVAWIWWKGVERLNIKLWK